MKAPILLSLFLYFWVFGDQNPVKITLLVPEAGATTSDTRSSPDPLAAHVADSSFPKPTMFVWSVQGSIRPLTFDVFISEDSLIDTSAHWVIGHPDTFLSVWNLKIATRYFWKVATRDDQGAVWTSPTSSFLTCSEWPRMLFIEGTTNVRDIGGINTSDGRMMGQGLFYRSAELNNGYMVTEKGFRELNRLGIACEIDLRRLNEDPHPSFPPSVRYVNPVDDSGFGIVQYSEGMIYYPYLYAKIFHEIAKPDNYPIFCHCRAGADRAATVTIILESVLGCSEEHMGDDYRWTSLSVDGIRDTAFDQWKRTISYIKSFDEQNKSPCIGACRYLLNQGVTGEELVSIRRIFLGDGTLPFTLLAGKAQSPRDTRFQALAPIVERRVSPSRSVFISFKNRLTRAVIVDCRGKRMGEYHALQQHAAANFAVPRLTNGVYFVYYFKN
jgi:protein-tyrosine phosphatase